MLSCRDASNNLISCSSKLKPDEQKKCRAGCADIYRLMLSLILINIGTAVPASEVSRNGADGKTSSTLKCMPAEQCNDGKGCLSSSTNVLLLISPNAYQYETRLVLESCFLIKDAMISSQYVENSVNDLMMRIFQDPLPMMNDASSSSSTHESDAAAAQRLSYARRCMITVCRSEIDRAVKSDNKRNNNSYSSNGNGRGKAGDVVAVCLAAMKVVAALEPALVMGLLAKLWRNATTATTVKCGSANLKNYKRDLIALTMFCYTNAYSSLSHASDTLTLLLESTSPVCALLCSLALHDKDSFVRHKYVLYKVLCIVVHYDKVCTVLNCLMVGIKLEV